MAQLEIARDKAKGEPGVGSFQDSLVSLIPHPVATAFLLTILIAVAGMAMGTSFEDVLKGWGQGFIGYYPFVMENLLILLLSFALGSTPAIRNTIGRLADSLNSQGAAVVAVAVVSILLSFFNWGVGVLGGVCLARETARRAQARGTRFDYPLLLTSGLAGVVVWESGFSGVVPLYLAEAKQFLVGTTGPLTLNQIVLSPLNLMVSVALLISVPLVLWLMRPSSPAVYEPEVEEPEAQGGPMEKSVAAYLERSHILSIFFGGLALIYVIRFFAAGKPLDLPNMLFALVALGIFLHGKPMDYQRDVIAGIKAIWFIALPLMFFCAIQGMMTAAKLNPALSGWLGSFSAVGLPVVTLVVSTCANFLVPNAGSQLLLGGPSIMEAAKAVGASYTTVALALAYGAGLAKLLQLYLFASALGLTDKEVRMGSLARYASIVFAVAFLVCVIGLVILPR